MTDRLTLKGENEVWYPASIQNLEQHLSELLRSNDYYTNEQIYPMRKNLAYSLQYLQFLNQTILDISLSSVLETQSIKSFLVHGAALIEAIFNYLVISNGFGNQTQWKKVSKHSTPEYELGDIKYKSDIEVFEKLGSPISAQMTFDQLAKKVEKKKLLGNAFTEYSKIKPIRQLRNKIHIHDSDHSYDTDWNNFNQSEFVLIAGVLYRILVSEVFAGSIHMDKFVYLVSTANQGQRSVSTSVD